MQQINSKNKPNDENRTTLKTVRAKERWKLLAEALKLGKCTHSNQPNEYSVRRFGGFNCFNVEKLLDGWQEWKLILQDVENRPVYIRLLENRTSAEELIGFNNTGNICIWPSEEILAYYLMKHQDSFHLRGKQICELGAGMTGLAGLQIGRNIDGVNVLLTDGNKMSVENLESLCERNARTHSSSQLRSRLLMWNNRASYSDLENTMDIIICADCLFFTEFHEDFVHTIATLMKDDGSCIIFAPKRSGTLDQFVKLAEQSFTVRQTEHYDSHITQLHKKFLGDAMYAADLHYPTFILLKSK